MLLKHVCLYYVYGIKASNRQHIQDSLSISLCRLLQISAKRSRLVSVPPLKQNGYAKTWWFPKLAQSSILAMDRVNWTEWVFETTSRLQVTGYGVGVLVWDGYVFGTSDIVNMLIVTISMIIVCLTQFSQKVDWASFGKALFGCKLLKHQRRVDCRRSFFTTHKWILHP